MGLKKLAALGRGTLGGGAHQKRAFTSYALRLLARRLDLRLYDRDSNWHRDEPFLEMMRRHDPDYKRVRERHFLLYSLARSLRHLPGDTAECGVYKGASSHLIMTAFDDARDHHLFDSFCGLSEPSDRDRPAGREAKPWAQGDLAFGRDAVETALQAHKNMHFHEGWIPAEFHHVTERSFCLVHIDVDLYAPTKDSFDFFYPRLVPGGMVVCDDYGFDTCPGARQAMDEGAAAMGRQVIHVPTGQGLVLK
jgi:hypothetical protein